MKREIKFRAWDEDKKEMLYPDGVFNFIGDGKWYHLDPHNENNVYYEIPKELDIMQYTGLKEKNGKEIYEDDIKRWKFNHHIRDYVCYWSEIDCGFRWKLIKHNSKQDDDNIDIPFDTEEDFYNYVIKSNQRANGFDSFSKIIGNIYENPELLK